MGGANIPAFQTFFNYVILNIVWTSITIYKYGFKGWLRMIYKNGWRYLILSFCDVEGNYFTVLGFRYVRTVSTQIQADWAADSTTDYNSIRSAHQLLGHRNRRHRILHLPPRPI